MLYIAQFMKVKNSIFSISDTKTRHFPLLCCTYQVIIFEKTTFQVPYTPKRHNYSEKLCKTYAFYTRNYNIWMSQTFSKFFTYNYYLDSVFQLICSIPGRSFRNSSTLRYFTPPADSAFSPR